MSIRWDSVLTHHLAGALETELAGARLRALRIDGAARDLALLFGDRTLLWRLHPAWGWVLLREPVEPAQSDVSLSGRLRRVVAPADERIVRFEFLPLRQRRAAYDLVVELLGNQWNAIVVETSSRVIRHVLSTRQAGRSHVVGRLYTPPPPSARVGASGELDRAELAALVEGHPPGERARALVREVAWTSPINAIAILGSSADGPADPGALHAAWARLVPGRTAPAPVVLETAKGPQPYPLPLDGYPNRPTASLLAAFEACAGEAALGHETATPLLLPQEELQRLEAMVNHVTRRVRRIEHELAGLGDASRERGLGDLILARYAEIPNGAPEAELTGFDGEPTRVALEPGASPHVSAERYYRRAGKIERALERLPRLASEARARAQRLVALLARARSGGATLEDVRAALPGAPAPEVGRRGPAGAALPYRVFRSSGGLEIRVGRGARMNDELTFRHSAPGDVWLHARDQAGAHVVLRWPGPGGPPARDLREAAVLAALHSRARTSGSAPVDWTLRKHVRKPRGAPPGRVAAERVKTLFVEPDDGLLELLADSRDASSDG